MGSGPGSVWGATWAQCVEGRPSWKTEPSLASYPGAQKTRVATVEKPEEKVGSEVRRAQIIWAW